MRQLDGIIDTMDMSLSKLWKIVKERKAWGAAVWGHKESDTTQQLNNNNISKVAVKDHLSVALSSDHMLTKQNSENYFSDPSQGEHR